MQPRRSFLAKAIAAITTMALSPFLRAKTPAPVPAHPQLQLRKAVIWGRSVPNDAGPIYAASFAELRPEDVFSIVNEDKTDPDHLTMWRVHEGPFPTDDPATQGPSYVIVEGV